MNNIENKKLYIIKKAPNYFNEKEKEKIVGCYFIPDSIETNNNDGVTYFRGVYLTGGWRLPITIEKNSLEEVDQTNKYTTYFYSGSGGIFTLIEVECETENAEDILAEGIKRLYKRYFDETTKKLNDNFFIISIEEANKLEKDVYYKKDYKEWKKRRKDNDNDFTTFLMEEYNYAYFDIEGIGPIFVINGEYLDYRKGWGISGMSCRINEELF